MKPGLSIIITTYNEEKNIEPTVRAVLKALEVNEITDYELLLVDKRGWDKTQEVIDRLAEQNSHIIAVHHLKNRDFRGLGHQYRVTVQRATKQYVAWIPGDDETSHESIVKVFGCLGKAEIILPYTENTEMRSLRRRFLSKFYTMVLNLLFSNHIRYYNGINIFPTAEVKKINITSNRHAYMAEIVIKLLNKKISYYETGIKINPTEQSSAIQFKNITDVAKMALKLFWQLRIKRIKS
ncbi:MAG: glycosyltransferase family 2 protein [Patescibacteria group bacterium]|jgi:glycosyltransferase involved in cell wall biosynthesis